MKFQSINTPDLPLVVAAGNTFQFLCSFYHTNSFSTGSL